ncbi:MAG: DUF488 domain-containing protein [candidate division WOR-3 bacterium]|nr:DUF488 domain-containing protein [candidate division WOR-3 bacterium]MCX7757495.1 DUF488 domain-containing protein [candidate division WOR-3 bacterium]MDW7987126.1 DUF488 domain-containing protein [candidate division WOR-3 bacterium]
MHSIYTLGTSNRTPEEFLKLLKKYSIEIIFDVRRFPKSRFLHFIQENLTELLKTHKIEYCYLGAELGGFRTGGYEKYMETNEFKTGIEIITNYAQEKIGCILCAERNPTQCHRRFISQALTKLGFNVIDIIE